MEKILKLYTYVDGTNDTPFPSADEQVIIGSFTYTANRMGSAPSITATVKHRLCLDDLWNDKVYAEFNGEKYFAINTPSSSKSNDDTRYEHDLELLSEREVLNHVYFIDAVQGDSDVDQYKSNSTKVQFYGNLVQFVGRLNASLSYRNLGYSAVIDDGISTEDKNVTFENKYILVALQEEFNVFEIPYYFVGKKIHFGYTANTITTPFKYGYDSALLSISKDNANYALINRITGTGSSDNIPYYYPNNSPKGDLGIKIISGNMVKSNFIITDYDKFSNSMSLTDVCKCTSVSDGGITSFKWSIGDNDILLSDIGIKLAENAMPQNGASFGQEVLSYITPSQNLMPPIYRETGGAERFYNAKNNTYTDDEGGYYEFENEYSDSNPREGITNFEDIKPTIVGVTNSVGHRIDSFIDFAYDTNDNDEVDENGEYLHPYFFAKLRKTDGSYGFNLFDQAIENQAMQISFTSGVCGACTFEIAVGDETQKNLVQVGDSGALMRDENGNVLCGRKDLQQPQTPQDRQNDTQKYEVWIALRKDSTTYPQVMPNVNYNYKPSTSDTFVILGINLPQAYILKAEDELEKSLIKYMWMNNVEKFTFSAKFSRIFFEENPDILLQLNENSRVLIEYNGRQHTLYIDNYTYKMDSGSPLPEIDVDLVDTLTIGKNSLQTQLDSVKQDILSSIGGGDFLKQGLKYFLRKDKADSTQYLLKLLGGAEFGVFTQGLLGTGGAVTIDEDGNSHAEFDYLTIRKIATFIELLIQEAKSVGGMIVVSPSNMKVSKVEETDSAYRCYFEKTDGERTVLNQFEEGDQARRQTFNLETGQAYYWRLVASVGDDYVDLSKTDCDTGSAVPQAGDEIVGIGNRTNKSRQSAIIISAYGDGSPSIRYYQGIDSYSLTGKAVKEDYYDLSTGRFKTVTYGDSYVGDREGNTFMKYDQENGVEVKGKVSMSSGSTGWENLEGLSGVIKDVSDAAIAAQNAADNAQDAADNAQADAESANNRLDQWAEDGVISPTEKLSLKQELENLQSEYDTNIQNAQKYGIDTSAYTSAWTAYRQELEYHSQDTPENITIKETFATSQSSFYKSREDLLVSIANAAKEYADKLVSSVSVGAENLLLNTGFTGNYDPKVLSASTPLNERTYMYSNRLENWSGAGTVNEDESSESGYSCSIGSIRQSVSLIEGERYVISYKAKGRSVTVSIGSNTWTDSLSSSYSVYSHKFEYSSGSVFAMAGSADVCEIKLERGTIPTDWCPSRKDTNEVADMFKQYWYLKDAMNGSTDVIGGLVLTSMMQLGKWTDGVMEKVNAGISGIYNEDTDVAFWAGGTFEQSIATVRKIIGGENPSDEEWKSLAKFVATHGGDIFLRGYIYALGGVFRGTVYAEDGEFNGMVSIAGGKILLSKDGSGKLANGNIEWDSEGNPTIKNANFKVQDEYGSEIEMNTDSVLGPVINIKNHDGDNIGQIRMEYGTGGVLIPIVSLSNTSTNGTTRIQPEGAFVSATIGGHHYVTQMEAGKLSILKDSVEVWAANQISND